MEEAISVIRQELLALKMCLTKTRALKDAVREASDAKGLKAALKETDTALLALSEATSAKTKFLKENNVKDMKTYLEAQGLSGKRDVSMRLLMQVGNAEKELLTEVFTTNELLKRSSAFVDYRMNVLAGAKADTTYGSSVKNANNAQKMFDANV